MVRAINSDEKSSWWYWFTKSDCGKLAKCNNCDWIKDRDEARSTSILRSHLRTKHPDLLLEKQKAEKNIQWSTVHIAHQSKTKKRKNSTSANNVDKCGTGKFMDNKQQCMNDNDDYEDTIANSSINSQRDFSDHDGDSPVKIETTGKQNSWSSDNLNDQMELNKVLISMIGGSFGDYTNPSTSTIDTCVIGSSSQFAASQSDKLNTEMPQDDNSKAQMEINSIYDANIVATDNSNQPHIVKLSRVETFSAAHRLHNTKFDCGLNKKIYGKCNNENSHGHNYKWKVVLEGPVSLETGMVYNMADLKKEMADVLELVDHMNLDKDVAYFRDHKYVSTTENLALFLFNELASRMKDPLFLKKVVVYETDKNSFSYSGPRVN